MATTTTNLTKSLWREAFGDEERPKLYASAKCQKNNDFAILSSPKCFVKNLEFLSHAQLYALAGNCQLALKTAQDEYLHIERLIRRLEQKDPPSDPQALLEPASFEEEKEATLYGYKRMPRGMPYTRTKDGTEFHGFQEPFSQGGFVPTDAQYRRMKANAKDPNNIDGWTPIEREGKRLIPRMPRSSPPRPRGFTSALSRPSRKRRLVEQGLSDTDAAAAAAAALSDSDALTNPNKRATRSLGQKFRPTQDPSETPATHGSSPIFQRQHLAAAPRTVANSTPVPPETSSPTPSSNKRRRISHQHDNPPFNSTINCRSSPARDDVEEKKWTDGALISAIHSDHSFLHPDPEVAVSWKHAILNAPNPVRSYAMKRKWAWWKKGGMDKRPRKAGREGSAADDESPEEDVLEMARTKTEEVQASYRLKKEEEEEKEEEGEDHEIPRLCRLGPGPPRPEKAAASVIGACETKQSIAMKQQRDGQFTFKLDHPPPPPPHTYIASMGPRR